MDVLDEKKTVKERKRSGGKTISVHGREFALLRSAAQKFMQRNDCDNLTKTILEISDSGFCRVAYQLLIKLALEEKFPNGAEHLPNMLEYLKIWNRLSAKQKDGEIAQMCATLTKYPTDRYPVDIAWVALSYSKKQKQPDVSELAFVREIERTLLTMRKENEMATPNDMPRVDEGFAKLKAMLFADMESDRVTHALFDCFQRTFSKEARLDSRVYLYNIVGRKFYPNACTPVDIMYASVPSVRRVDTFDESVVHDRNTTEGQSKKRGWKHAVKLTETIQSMSEERKGIKRKADLIRLADERKYGTKASTPECERKRIRDTFNELVTVKGQAVKSTILCQKPSARKPRTQYVELANNTRYFLKGPFKTRDSLEFQIQMDTKKEEYGLTPMHMEILEQGALFYLCAKVEHPYVNMVAGKVYSDEVIWQLIRILIFRYAFNISDSNLRNVMIWTHTDEKGNEKSTLMSVDEMGPRGAPPRAHGLIFQLFHLPPRKDFVEQVLRVIRQRRDEFLVEVDKYGDRAKNLTQSM